MGFLLRSLSTKTPIPLLLLFTASYGCSFVYYLKLSATEAKILWNRTPLERIIDEGFFSDEERAKLNLILKLREFSSESLGLDVKGYYSSYSSVKKGIRLYVLTVCRKDSLKPLRWKYPLIGTLPYRGFFEKKDAEKEALKYRQRGFDVYLRETAGYSTLGWFNDPLLPHHLKLSSVDLVNTVIHEIVHSNIFVKNRPEFNESFANFIGMKGTAEFFRIQKGQDSEEYLNSLTQWKEALLFSDALEILLGRLDELYKSDIELNKKLELREMVLEKWKEEVRESLRDEGFLKRIDNVSMNNAMLYSLFLYYKDLGRFERVISEGITLKEMIDLFRGYDGNIDPFEYLNMRKEERKISVDQCGDIKIR